ncbi:hypothetical protein K8640_09285 [Myxococcus sp. XM-1-1-1]|uniref:SMP-30/gluconolactonase/LRE family protein n=1 Tax=Myxococcus sp. XM-1-1-1 TaxID=2874602 RepID=UPI001CC06783|nr:hypothetical protein [Myxococcus sp. XM-1-1-1]MBZ4408404.1 hypothetical protein [Myxococcus sp. XM-1-1-1]
MCPLPLASVLSTLLLITSPATPPHSKARASGAVTPASASTTPGPHGFERMSLPSGFTVPNGIAVDDQGTLYVGSVADGRVLRRVAGGDWTEFFPGSEQVFSVTSLRLDAPRNLLWGTSPDAMGLLRPQGVAGGRGARVFALDARSGALLKVIPLPAGALGNDLAVAPDGGLYVTDSHRAAVLYLRPDSEAWETWVMAPRFSARGPGMSAVGPAGIALAPDGSTLVINTFGPGRLFVIRPGARGQGPSVREVSLPRRLENPDGMRFAPDGRLLLVEGATQSGDGRLVRIDVLGKSRGAKVLEVLASGMESPVNLTVSDEGTVWVTEARLRDRILRGPEAALPQVFWVASLPLPR